MVKAERKHRTPGIKWRNSGWYIDKLHRGYRIKKSCRTTDPQKADEFLANEILRINKAIDYGIGKDYTCNDAFVKRMETLTHKASADTARAILRLTDYIGNVLLTDIYTDHPQIQKFIKDRQAENKANSTINRDLSELNTILKLSAKDWRDPITKKPWLPQMPGIVKKLPTIKKNDNFKGKESRKAYILTRAEEARLLSFMPLWQQRICLFALNTGARQQEICNLKWSNERQIDGHSIFILSMDEHKGGNYSGEGKIIFTNSIAREVLHHQRKLDCEWVFPSNQWVSQREKAKRERRRIPPAFQVSRITNKIYYRAWEKAGLPGNDYGYKKGCHNFRHTVATRLRSAKVNKEDRTDILGHESDDVTTHYSSGEIVQLCEKLELLVGLADPVFLGQIT